MLSTFPLVDLKKGFSGYFGMEKKTYLQNKGQTYIIAQHHYCTQTSRDIFEKMYRTACSSTTLFTIHIFDSVNTNDAIDEQPLKT